MVVCQCCHGVVFIVEMKGKVGLAEKKTIYAIRGHGLYHLYIVICFRDVLRVYTPGRRSP